MHSPGRVPTLTDTEALNRICATINDSRLSGADVYMAVANLVTDTGRPVVETPVDITASVRRNAHGLPVAHVDTDEADIGVTVYQRQQLDAIVVEITTASGTRPRNLLVTVNRAIADLP